MASPTKESLIKDLQGLSITAGDAVLVRANLFEISRSPKTLLTFIDVLLELVGPEGTIVCPTFTKGGHPDLLDESKPFDRNTPPTTGWLSKLFLSHPDVIRSSHPLTSWAAIGKNAEYICAEHDETKPDIWPVGRMMDLNAKQANIGALKQNVGFETVHWVQYTLGLALRLRRKGDYAVYYRKGDKTELFVAEDRGGCARGFDKLYTFYEEKGIMTSGYVGDADAICVNMKEAFEIELEILRKNPRFVLCDRPFYTKCRTWWTYNRRDIPMYHLRRLLGRVSTLPRRLSA